MSKMAFLLKLDVTKIKCFTVCIFLFWVQHTLHILKLEKIDHNSNYSNHTVMIILGIVGVCQDDSVSNTNAWCRSLLHAIPVSDPSTLRAVYIVLIPCWVRLQFSHLDFPITHCRWRSRRSGYPGRFPFWIRKRLAPCFRVRFSQSLKKMKFFKKKSK